MRKIRSLFCLGCFVFAAFVASAQGQLSPGKNFIDMGTASTVSTTSGTVGAGNKEVVEFFMYRCPHCRTSREEVDTWRRNLPKGTTFRRVPLVFGPLDLAHASMYYTLESLGKLEELDARVFQAVQTDRKLLSTPEEQASFFQEAGIAPEAYMKAHSAFSVKAKVSRATREAQALAIDAAPSLVVAGRYLTNPTLAGSASEAIRVAGSLLDRVIAGDTRGLADATVAAKSAVSGQSGSLAAGLVNTPSQTTTSPPATKPPAGGATTGTVVSTGQGGSRPVGVEAGNLYFVQAEYPGEVGLNKDTAPMMFAAIDSQTALSAIRQFHLKRYPSGTPPLLTVRGECTGTSSWGAVVYYRDEGSAATKWAKKHRWGGGCGATPAAAILSAEQACISRGGSCNANRQANALVYVDLAHSGAAPWLAAWASEPSAYMSWGAIGATTRMHDNASYVDSPADAIAKLGKVCAGNYGPRPCFFVSTQWRECLMKYDRSDQAGRCTETRLTPQGFTGAVRH